MKKYFSVFALLAMTELFSACGVKGPLYMPPEPPDPVADNERRALAVKKEKLLEVKDCGIVLDDEDRALCYELHEKRDEDLKICDLITDKDNKKLCLKDVLGKAYKEDPYLETAKVRCADIDDDDSRAQCISEINEERLDEEAIARCNLVLEDSQRESCLESYRKEKASRLKSKEALRKLNEASYKAESRQGIVVVKPGSSKDRDGASVQDSLGSDELDLLYRLQ